MIDSQWPALDGARAERARLFSELEHCRDQPDPALGDMATQDWLGRVPDLETAIRETDEHIHFLETEVAYPWRRRNA